MEKTWKVRKKGGDGNRMTWKKCIGKEITRKGMRKENKEMKGKMASKWERTFKVGWKEEDFVIKVGKGFF